MPVQLLLRKRYSWSIECETDAVTKSQNFYNSVRGIREYFFDFAQMTEFEEISESHANAEGGSKYHDDTHIKDNFHVHMDGQPVEVEIKKVQLLEGVFLLYGVIIASVFILQSSAKQSEEQLS